MTTDDRSEDRAARLLPEEQKAGSANPQEQAEVILAESDERTEDPQGTRERSTQGPQAQQTEPHQTQ